MSSDQKSITNLAEYIAEINQLVSDNSDHRYIYRGQKKDKWLVQSSAIRRLQKEPSEHPELMRYLFMDYIHQMIDEVQLRYAGSYRDLEALECMAHLQHNKVATGLVDFTYNPLVALWFACESDETADGGKVFVVNIQSDKVKEIKTKKALKEDLKKFFEKDKQWYLWQPSIGNSNIDTQRMTMQQSVFLFGGPEVKEVGMIKRKILIPEKHKKKLRQELEAMGISDKTLFSDLAGFFERNTTESAYDRKLAENYYTEEIKKSEANKDDEAIISENYFQRANVRAALGKYKDAIADYDQAIELNSEYDEAYNGRGVAKYELGQHEDAIADFNQALRIDPQFVEAYNNRGNAKAKLGQYEEAIEEAIKEAIADYDKAIELNPQYANAYYNRGNAKHALGQYEDAIADYDKAIYLNPQDAYAYNNRGVTKRALGRHEEAIADYDEAIRLNPQDAGAYNNRGFTKYILGRYQEAIVDYDQAVRIDPQYAKAYSNRGDAKAKLGQHEEAKADYEKARQLTPEEDAEHRRQLEKLIDGLACLGSQEPDTPTRKK